MSEVPLGPGWWVASDGRYYPPELHPTASAPPPPPGPPSAPQPGPATGPAPTAAPLVSDTQTAAGWIPGAPPRFGPQLPDRVGNGVRIAGLEWALAALVVLIVAGAVLGAYALGRHDPYGHHSLFTSSPTTVVPKPTSAAAASALSERQLATTPPGWLVTPVPPPALQLERLAAASGSSDVATRAWSAGNGLWYSAAIARFPAGTPVAAKIADVAAAVCGAAGAGAPTATATPAQSVRIVCAPGAGNVTAVVGVAQWPVMALAVSQTAAPAVTDGLLEQLVATEYARIGALHAPSGPPPGKPFDWTWLEVVAALCVAFFGIAWVVGMAHAQATGARLGPLVVALLLVSLLAPTYIGFAFGGLGPLVAVLVVAPLSVPALAGLWIGSTGTRRRVAAGRRELAAHERQEWAELRARMRGEPAPPPPVAAPRPTVEDVHEKMSTHWRVYHRAGRGSFVVVLLAFVIAGFAVVRVRAVMLTDLHRRDAISTSDARYQSPTAIAEKVMQTVYDSNSTPDDLLVDVVPAQRPALQTAARTGAFTVPGTSTTAPPYVEGRILQAQFTAVETHTVDATHVDVTVTDVLSVSPVAPDGATTAGGADYTIIATLHTVEVGGKWYVEYPWGVAPTP